MQLVGQLLMQFNSNSSFIDGLIHRQMRKSLLESFDEIYILDLHGNAKKQETSPDGSKDENVFDIMQGVSINLFIKTGKKAKGSLGQVFNHSLYGKREEKYNALNDGEISSLPWQKLDVIAPDYFFSVKNFDNTDLYKNGFSVIELFSLIGSGISFRKDSLLIRQNDTKKDVYQMIDDIKSLDPSILESKYSFKQSIDWKVIEQRQNFLNPLNDDIKQVSYRPFDSKYAYYPLEKISQIIPRGDSRKNIMQHMLKENLTLIFERSVTIGDFTNIFISNKLVEAHVLGTMFSKGYVAPLYIYPDASDLLAEVSRIPNLNMQIVETISKGLNLTFTREKEDLTNTIAPIDLLDYIYAVLHSPTYRETYKEFLKIDYPRVPYPSDEEQFFQLVALGGELRQLHLLEGAAINQLITSYPESGNNLVDKPRYKNSKVYINDTQYFDGVPKLAWEFYIGGYQPAQKWLKDRKGRILSYEDILHYQKIIKAMVETDRLMHEIDKFKIV